MLNRFSPPAFHEAELFPSPLPEKFSTNVVDVYWLSEIQQPAVRIEVVWPAGKWYEPKPGLSHFLASLLDKGTSSKTAAQIAEELEFSGSSLEMHAGSDHLSATLYTISSQAENIWPLFFQILTDSIFPEDELRQAKTIYRQNLQVNRQKTSFLASHAMREVLFGRQHPYGSQVEEGEVNAIAQSDLAGYFRSLGTPLIFITGRLPERFISQILREMSSHKWLSGQLVQWVIKQGEQNTHISLDKSIQTSIRLARHSINRLDANYPAVVMANHVLGGYFGSRLMKNIREEKGLTYGIYSTVNPYQNASILYIGADVNKENTDEAIAEITKELKSLSIIDQAEYVVARNHFLGSLQLEVANPFAVMDRFKTAKLMELPVDFYSQLFTSIKSLSSHQLSAIAEQYFLPSDFKIITAG